MTYQKKTNSKSSEMVAPLVNFCIAFQLRAKLALLRSCLVTHEMQPDLGPCCLIMQFPPPLFLARSQWRLYPKNHRRTAMKLTLLLRPTYSQTDWHFGGRSGDLDLQRPL